MQEDILSRNFGKAVHQSSLLEKAITKLEERYQQEPENSQVLERLAGLYRGNGRLEEATQSYQELGKLLTPLPPVVSYLQAVLKSEELPYEKPQAALWPTPFVRIQNFFPEKEHAKFLPYALHRKNDFEYALVGTNSEPEFDYRTSLSLNKPKEIHEWFEPKLRQLLPKILSRLQLTPFPLGKIEFRLMVCLDGHFYKVHRDNILKKSRKLSYVYYFHRQPKAFQGGDLLLYDTNVSTKDSPRNQFTRIAPEDNSLILFPSSYFHEITQVDCPSKAFRDGRFAIVGHIQEAT